MLYVGLKQATLQAADWIVHQSQCSACVQDSVHSRYADVCRTVGSATLGTSPTAQVACESLSAAVHLLQLLCQDRLRQQASCIVPSASLFLLPESRQQVIASIKIPMARTTSKRQRLHLPATRTCRVARVSLLVLSRQTRARPVVYMPQVTVINLQFQRSRSIARSWATGRSLPLLRSLHATASTGASFAATAVANIEETAPSLAPVVSSASGLFSCCVLRPLSTGL